VFSLGGEDALLKTLKEWVQQYLGIAKLRRINREWIVKYPSIARLVTNIIGRRRMGAIGTLENCIKVTGFLYITWT